MAAKNLFQVTEYLKILISLCESSGKWCESELHRARREKKGMLNKTPNRVSLVTKKKNWSQIQFAGCLHKICQRCECISVLCSIAKVSVQLKVTYNFKRKRKRPHK